MYKVSNLVLCTYIWNDSNIPNVKKIDSVMEKIKADNSFSDRQLLSIRDRLANNFFPQFTKMWKKVTRKKDLFLEKYQFFLRKHFEVEFDSTVTNDHDNQQNAPEKRKGRPRVPYNEGGPKTKIRRISELASAHSQEELSKALKLNERLNDSPSTQNCYSNTNTNNVLAMYVDLHLTKRKYEKLRKHSAIMGSDFVYPTYAAVVKAKAECYPENIKVSDKGASVHLISVLDHTIKRILMQLNHDELENFRNEKLLFIGKWGMDGATSQQTTRQKWSAEEHADVDDSGDEEDMSADNENTAITSSDAAMFIISFVPLQLRCNDLVIWNNETPNSPHFCRPIKFKFIKENDKYIQREYKYYTKLLEKVEVYNLRFEDFLFEVNFQFECTMIDGKVCNVLSGQKASTRCNICTVGPKLVNVLNHVNRLPCHEQFYKLGLSTLHCWIRFMEYLLHVSYNLDFKKGSARTQEEKASKKARKQDVQQKLKPLSITVDVVKQGSGTTNTGNVARTFFMKAEAVALATGLSEILIKRLHNILQALTCCRKVDCEKFGNYCSETAELCVQLYPWYKIPPSVHKVLQHGSKIIQSFELPIGCYSEEPQEANNKIFRKARLENARMCDRKMANTDIMRQMLVSSDPLISSLRIKEKKKRKPLAEEAELLLICNE